MSVSNQFVKVNELYSEYKTEKSPWNSQFIELQRYFRPQSASFFSDTTRGNKTNNKLFDTTAVWAVEQFASGLFAFNVDPSTRWLQMTWPDVPTEYITRDEKEYLDKLTDIVLFDYSNPWTNFGPGTYEMFQELGVFGTGVIRNEWDNVNKRSIFRACPLGKCSIGENIDGFVDTIFYSERLTRRQFLEKWPHLEDHPKLKALQTTTRLEVVHHVAPNKEAKYITSKTNPKGKPFTSIYFCPDIEEILESDFLYDFPYSVVRWSKRPGETYGRSQGMLCLSAAKNVDIMKRELIAAAELANWPPMLFEDESILFGGDRGDFKIQPRSVLWKDPQFGNPEPMQSGNQPQLPLEIITEEREFIKQCFYVDSFLRARKNERQSVTEILDERSEMLRQMSPNTMKIQTEFLTHTIQTTLDRMDRAGMLPEPPARLANFRLKVTYRSPAAMAQMGSKASNISAFMNDAAAILNIDQQAVAELDARALLNELAILRDVSTVAIKDPAKRKREEQELAQQQQNQQMLEAGPAIGKTLKDVASAKATDPELLQDIGI